MKGQLSSGQERLFYSFNLEDHIPTNHLLHSIDQCLDLSDLRHYLADFYSPIGDGDLFRWLFNEVLRRSMDAGLVKGEGFAVDASIIKADASRQREVPGDEPVNWSDPSLKESAEGVRLE